MQTPLRTPLKDSDELNELHDRFDAQIPPGLGSDHLQRRQGYLPARTPEVTATERRFDQQQAHVHNGSPLRSFGRRGSIPIQPAPVSTSSSGVAAKQSSRSSSVSLNYADSAQHLHQNHHHNQRPLQETTSVNSPSFVFPQNAGRGGGATNGSSAGGVAVNGSSTGMHKSASNTSSISGTTVYDSPKRSRSGSMSDYSTDNPFGSPNGTVVSNGSPETNSSPFMKKHNVIPSLSSTLPPVTSPLSAKAHQFKGTKWGWPGLSSPPGYAQSQALNTAAAARRQAWDTPTAWMIYYFIANLSLTLYNKLLMNKFPFPWALTGVHTLCGALGSQACLSRGLFTQQRLSTKENAVLVAFSFLYTVNIAVSNLSLNLVTVPVRMGRVASGHHRRLENSHIWLGADYCNRFCTQFHQVVRAMTPLFTIVLATIFLGKRSKRATYLSLIPVVLGVVFATYGDYYFTTWGLCLTLLGTLLAAMKTIVTNMILVGRLKLHPLDLLLRMSPLAFAQCIFASWYTGELQQVRAYGATEMDTNKFLGLAINGMIAFALNVVSFTVRFAFPFGGIVG